MTGLRMPTNDRETAMRLAADEYGRFVELLQDLPPDAWRRPTVCDGWDVHAMVAHCVGMTQMAGSLWQQARQNVTATARARRSGREAIDELTALQVQEHTGAEPAALIRAMQRYGPRAARGRRRTPAWVRTRPLPGTQVVGSQRERWSLGYLIDTILTRDPWLHRADIVEATGVAHRLTAEHDGLILGDVVREWALRHGQPFELTLTGPAGGHWSSGDGAEPLHLDAIDFCRTLSGRRPGSGLLAVAVPF
ncbi:maleylpyruvate isomerase family mycothiol-dependent enzyme [Cumulibacter manganitolerans]|uniref:maleylpyruvate isomerase family mycothiol-dependent enzyme n=1 Tax=Cumulibacter manganitolerans TaxID=1884992 RepID=UPI001E4F9673|nr:maleylpyruvate isomerase family mycothiol-dependent enzyme [Cumulibacter manganitolerans]